MAKIEFLQAINHASNGIPASGPGTLIVSIELMDFLGVYFPEAHLNAGQMAKLAVAGHKIYGFDVVMPLFSVWHESAAIGCRVNWGEKDAMPYCNKPIFETDRDINIPENFVKHESCQVPLNAISMLKKELGTDAAICGKVFGPWTLGYHVFGVENFLINTLLQPDMIKRSLEKLKSITIRFADAQIEAGVDCILLADHATRDLCSPKMYKEFLQQIHAEIVDRIPCPLILHICGNTSDRIKMIDEMGINCFHWDTKTGTPKKVRELAGPRLSLMGGINNIELLRGGSEDQIRAAIEDNISAGIDIIAPECAVPLDTPMKNLEIIGKYVIEYRKRLN